MSERPSVARGMFLWVVGTAGVFIGSAVVGLIVTLVIDLLFSWAGISLADGDRTGLFCVVSFLCVVGSGMYALERTT